MVLRINQMRHKKSLLPCYTTRPAVRGRRSIFLCGIKKSCSDPAGPDVERDGIGEDAHVVVMVEDGTISVPMRIQWTNIWGKKSRQHLHQLQRSLRCQRSCRPSQFQQRLGGCPTCHALFRSGITERPLNEASIL